MPNQLSPQLLSQLFAQQSEDPILILLTLNHVSFGAPIRLVNNTENIVSRGNTFLSFPFKIVLPIDDGESAREVSLEIDNVSLELIDELRTVTSAIDVKIEAVLASLPNEVQIELEELKINNVSYNATKISANLFLDNFLATEMTSEKYLPLNFKGLF